MRAPKTPLQPSGWVVLFVGAVSLIGAAILGWRELVVLAVGCAVVLAVSIPFVIGRAEIQLERVLIPPRVTRGEVAIAELTAINSGSASSPRRTILDAIDGRLVPVKIPTLKAGASSVQTWELPTERRGLRKVGPARITKSDPCRLMQREVGQTGVDNFWVQPRVLFIDTFASGLTKDMDGPTFDHSPAGDVAFHAIRPYRMGDDARHVHWMATARAGEMMVRHYVDNRQPYLSVVLDTSAASWPDPEAFELAVDITASLGVSALRARQPVSVHSSGQTIVGRDRPASPQLVLDALTVVEIEADSDVAAAAGRFVAAERATTVAVLVTGDAQATQLLASTMQLSSMCEVLIVGVGVPGDEENSPSTVGRHSGRLSVTDLDQFARLINHRVSVA